MYRKSPLLEEVHKSCAQLAGPFGDLEACLVCKPPVSCAPFGRTLDFCASSACIRALQDALGVNAVVVWNVQCTQQEWICRALLWAPSGPSRQDQLHWVFEAHSYDLHFADAEYSHSGLIQALNPTSQVVTSASAALGFGRERAPKTRIGGSGTCADSLTLYPTFLGCDLEAILNVELQPSLVPSGMSCFGASLGIECEAQRAPSSLRGVFQPIPIKPEDCRCPNGTSVALGCLPAFLRCMPYLEGLLEWLAHAVIPFFCSLYVLVAFALLKLLFARAPGCSSLPGRVFRAIFAGAPKPVLIALAVAVPQSPVLSWQAISKPSRRKQHRLPSFFPAFFRSGAFWIFGFAHLPRCVWAAPKGIADLVHEVPRILQVIPDALPPDPSCDRARGHHDQFAEAVRNNPDIVVLPQDRDHSATGSSSDHWFGVTVYAAQYQTVSFGLHVGSSISLTGIIARTSRLYRQVHPALNSLVPTQPQRSRGSASFIAFCGHVVQPGTAHVLVDLTAVGGHIFADVIDAAMLVVCLLERYQQEVKYDIEEMEVKVGSRLCLKTLPDQLCAETGDMLLVVPKPAYVEWRQPRL